MPDQGGILPVRVCFFPNLVCIFPNRDASLPVQVGILPDGVCILPDRVGMAQKQKLSIGVWGKRFVSKLGECTRARKYQFLTIDPLGNDFKMIETR